MTYYAFKACSGKGHVNDHLQLPGMNSCLKPLGSYDGNEGLKKCQGGLAFSDCIKEIRGGKLCIL